MRPEEAARLAACISHPVRVEFLTMIRESDRLSPVGFARQTGRPVDTVAYHVKALRKAGVIEESGTQRRRSALEHFYSPRPGVCWEILTRLLDVLDPSG
jgi:predicted transcriptional regulator